jgi:1-phosphatidylinositol-4-phosphate 5-kinase
MLINEKLIQERFSEGRSGAFMFFTSDEKLIVKTMSPEECSFLRKMAPNYEAYMTSHRNSLLTRFYGCHAVSLYGKMYYFVVMGNLFADTQVRSVWNRCISMSHRVVNRWFIIDMI